MERRETRFEWQVVDDEVEWRRLQESLPAAPNVLDTPADLAAQRRRWTAGALLAGVVVLAAGGWIWHTVQLELLRIEREIKSVVRLEVQAAVQGRNWLTEAVIAGDTSPAWQAQYEREIAALHLSLQSIPENLIADYTAVQVEMVNTQDDKAVVSVIIHAGAQRYRQTRFYRQTSFGWQRIPPDEGMWGAWRTLETDHFIIRYQRRDREAVATLGEQVEALYAHLAQNFGRTLTTDSATGRTDGGKMVIEVSVMQPPGSVTLAGSMDQPLRIASPALYLAPVEISDSDLLAQSIALPLLAQELARTDVLPKWQPLMEGLRLWQLWDWQLPLSAWQEEITKWVYVDVLNAENGVFGVLPEHYTELCVEHILWLSSPAQIHVPLLCTNVERTDWMILWRYLRVPSTRFDQLDVTQVWRLERPEVQNILHTSTRPGEAVALATIIDYAVDTYGRDRLPLLLKGLGRYDHWNVLLPEVFGVSAAEFERGWQSYLMNHYGMGQIR